MPEIREAEITINGRPLTQGQSQVLRTACILLRKDLNNPKVVEALGLPSITMHANLAEIIRLFDETPA